MTSIAFVTPLDRRSAIAHVSVSIVDELRALADVTIFAEPSDSPIASPVPVHPITSYRCLDQLAEFDHTVVSLGDSLFHRWGYGIARRMRTTIMLHDVVLAHLVYGVEQPDDFADILRRHHSIEEAEAALASLHGIAPFLATREVQRFPLVEPALEKARGVVVHSRFAEKAVAPKTIAPLRTIPLPFPVREQSEPISSTRDRPPSSSYTISTIGHANPNKQHELVIEALSELDDLDRPVRYVVAGPIEEDRRSNLIGLAAALGVVHRLEFRGRVTDAELTKVIAGSDVCLNLRNPTIEGASASALEQMAGGRAVIVMDHGSYSEFPDDAVRKVHPAIDPTGLAAVISTLLTSPEERARVGRAARAYVALHHTPASYAKQLLDFLDGVDAYRPLNDVLGKVASITRDWRQTPGSEFPVRVARTLGHLVG